MIVTLESLVIMVIRGMKDLLRPLKMKPKTVRPRAQTSVRSPRVEGEKVSGPPKLTHVAATSTTPKNDPLHLDALIPLTEAAGRPTGKQQVYYPSFTALPTISTQLYQTVDYGFSLWVPESVFHYYCAVAAFARLLKLKKRTGAILEYSERVFMDAIYNADLHIPAALNDYLTGFGNFKLYGIEVKVKFKSLKYLTSNDDGSVGWFGRVDHTTHWMYMSYPCLAVYLARIQMDLVYTRERNLPREWQLPDDIRPAGHAGLPTPNLLGYDLAKSLTPMQVQWLTEVGWNEAGDFTPDMDLMMSTIRAVQTELLATTLKLSPLTSDETVQFVKTRTSPRAISILPEVKASMLAIYGCKVTGTEVVAPKSLPLLQKHVIDDDHNNWSIYDWNEFGNVPDSWRATANTLWVRSVSRFKRIHCIVYA
ncbi:uncharacterized protein LOC143218238 [Lasioglossum baleicum]|uniref:uncharacterized protein LOC143218238 n=1 Tax=Lasioglossum baleicum TaxID=434251 RepID=UPI003FCEDD27